MTITDATLPTAFWTALRTRINTAAPYTTNPSTAATSSASIKASYKDLETARPNIVIDPAAISNTPDSFGMTTGQKDINAVIRVFTEFSVGVDQLDEQIQNALIADDIDGVTLVTIESSPDAPADPTNIKFYSKTISVAYQRR